MKDYVNAMPLELVYVSPTDMGQWKHILLLVQILYASTSNIVLDDGRNLTNIA